MKAVRLMFIMFLAMLPAGALWPGFSRAASKPPCPDPPPVDRSLYDVLQKARRSLDAVQNRAALKILSAYAVAHPKTKQYHLSFLMGTAHYRLNQPDRAEVCFMAAAGLRPCAGEVWQSVGAVRSMQGDYAGAAAALSVAYRLESPAVDGWRKLGDLYRLAGVPLKAVQAYRNAFGNDPAPEALDLLSDAWLEAHDLEKGTRERPHSREQSPDSPSVGAYRRHLPQAGGAPRRALPPTAGPPPSTTATAG